ncbi:MAG: PLP-dependent aspartate aminotransferase family protein, partial [Clostridia bacterium]
GTYRLLNEFIKKNGITITFCDASDTNKFCALLRPETTLVFIETPTNPLMKVTDIYEISSKIGKKAILACDNTFLSPVFQKPLDLGADISIHSATKYICGHHDTSAGLVITNNYDIAEKISFALRTHGSGLSPFDSFLVRRGFETLCLRMERHNQNSLKVFEFLTHCKEIEKIYYVGDKNHPDYAVTQKQTSGFGGMLSFVFCKGYEVKEFINRLKLIIFAESLGGNSSLITHPYTQTHASLPVEVRLKNGITPMLLRLSVGTENANDIICDIKEAL